LLNIGAFGNCMQRTRAALDPTGQIVDLADLAASNVSVLKARQLSATPACGLQSLQVVDCGPGALGWLGGEADGQAVTDSYAVAFCKVHPVPLTLRSECDDGAHRW
jgi:hypothetical protein